MAEKTAEQLSALIDGEVEDLELDLALRRLAREPDLTGRWERYHLISDALKNNLPEALDTGFAQRLRQAIDQEPPLTAPVPAAPMPSRSTWYRSAAGFGLAASLAVAVFIGLQQSATDGALDGPALVVAPAPEIQPLPQQAPILAGTEELEARLDTYIINHNGFASRNSVSGVLPYIRMVGHSSNP